MSARRWALAGGLEQLRLEADQRWPRRDRGSDGTIGDLAHAERTTDHNPDAGGVVRGMDLDAWDIDARDPSDDVAATIAEHLRARRDPRVKYVIWSGRMFSSYPSGGVPAWTWRRYDGPNGHFHHVHVSVVAGAAGQDRTPWGLLTAVPQPTPPPARPAPPEDDDMTQRLHLIKGPITPNIFELDLVTGRRREIPWAEMETRRAIGAWNEPAVVDQKIFDALRKGVVDLDEQPS